MGARTRRGEVGVVDLARELGISTATVSRALNGSSAVRPELAQRVREHAEARGYVANRLARALSANTSRAFVGFVIPYVDTPAYSAVAAECARLLSRDGTQMILTITENDPELEHRQLRELLASRVAGLIVSPSTHILDASKQLLTSVPVVQLHRSCGIEAPGVFSDDEQAMAECVLHLAALGHRHIAYLGTPVALSNGAVRLRGVRRGIELAGLNEDDVTMSLVEPTQQNGHQATLDLLREKPTALMIGGGSLSVGAAHAVRERGLRLPDDLSLVAYGDPSWFALSEPPLTTVAVSYQALAETAAELLLARLDERHRSPATTHLIPPQLRLAGSTGPRNPGEHNGVPGGNAC
ncbi:LacI family DNA-binding transcriptional regulator [Pseudonocardia spinosispora]|uniref:LacI family DNA-binding transcriptional regulator n=1 Tax=Pseudonocardia spinosispora TaxID=103441 RepID=UPI000422CC76|nr:LacI family DNA-binding transcriptional regulator [Pseudonocardia spinosispora]